MSFIHQSLVLVREDHELCEVAIAVGDSVNVRRTGTLLWELYIPRLMGPETEIRRLWFGHPKPCEYSLYVVKRDEDGNLLEEHRIAERLLLSRLACSMSEPSGTTIAEDVGFYTSVSPILEL